MKRTLLIVTIVFLSLAFFLRAGCEIFIANDMEPPFPVYAHMSTNVCTTNNKCDCFDAQLAYYRITCITNYNAVSAEVTTNSTNYKTNFYTNCYIQSSAIDPVIGTNYTIIEVDAHTNITNTYANDVTNCVILETYLSNKPGILVCFWALNQVTYDSDFQGYNIYISTNAVDAETWSNYNTTNYEYLNAGKSNTFYLNTNFLEFIIKNPFVALVNNIPTIEKNFAVYPDTLGSISYTSLEGIILTEDILKNHNTNYSLNSGMTYYIGVTAFGRNATIETESFMLAITNITIP